MSLINLEKFEQYCFGKIESVQSLNNILTNEEDTMVQNNLILDCSSLSEIELNGLYSFLEKFSLTLMNVEKTFIIIHPSFPTDKWEDVIVIPTYHEAKEYVFMEELTRGF